MKTRYDKNNCNQAQEAFKLEMATYQCLLRKKFWLVWLNVLIERFTNSKILTVVRATNSPWYWRPHKPLKFDDLIRLTLSKGTIYWLVVSATASLQVVNISWNPTVVEGDVLEKVEELGFCWLLFSQSSLHAAGIRAFKNCCQILPVLSYFWCHLTLHTSMPEKAYRYPLPTKYYTDNKVRNMVPTDKPPVCRAGEEVKLLLGRLEDFKLITCHSRPRGFSNTAKGGKSVDFLGDSHHLEVMMELVQEILDPAIIPYLMQYTEVILILPEDISRVFST